jgi:putative SOS response-associated peptidase YedK
MCGRATITRIELEEIAADLGAEFDAADGARYQPRFNLAPTDLSWLVVLTDGKRRIVPAVWGLPGGKKPIINVRGESVQRGAFRNHQHALFVADGFFEWAPGSKQPYWLHRSDGGLILFAALHAPLAAASSRAAVACTIITAKPGPDVAPFHDREPVMLAGARADEWLRGGGVELLAASPAGTLTATPVSKRVNRVANDDPTVIAPAPMERPRQGSLFDRRS